MTLYSKIFEIYAIDHPIDSRRLKENSIEPVIKNIAVKEDEDFRMKNINHAKQLYSAIMTDSFP